MRLSSALLCLTMLHKVAGEVPGDRVGSLPGFSGTLPTKHWSGYIKVQNPHGGNAFLHYYLVENSEQKADAPTLLWNNGGPGSSSLMGMMTENGPYTLNDDSYNTQEYKDTGVPTVFLNPNSWHTAGVNVLYVEHPVPTGFSYCDTPPCGGWNDSSQAVVQYEFLVGFFAAYPELAKNRFFATGESYAGVLIPTVSMQILEHRTGENKNTAPWNLEGYALGNDCPGNQVETCTPYSGWIGAKTAVEFRFYHGMIKEETYQKIVTACKDYWYQYDAPPEPCKSLIGDPIRPVISEAGDTYNMGGGYFLYDQCQPDLEALSGKGRDVPTPDREGALDRAMLREPYNLTAGEYACGQERASHEWLNLAAVQKAINVELVDKTSFEWSTGLNYTYTAHSLVETYNHTLIENFRIWQYSGDADPCVPYIGTQKWIDSLKIPIEANWRPWTAPGTMPVTGYVTKYAKNGFTFVTIRDAGHMSPRNKPRELLYMIKSFLSDSKL